MTTDHEAREAAVNALRQDHMGAIYPTRKSGLKEIANAAIDAYIAKLREGVADAREALEAEVVWVLAGAGLEPSKRFTTARAILKSLAEHGFTRRPMPSRDEIADEVCGIQVGSGYYATVIGRDAALEAADAVLALLEGKSDE